MVLQAYIDDSRSDDGTMVLAGFVSTTEKWAAFSTEWRNMLPYGVKAPDTGKNRYHFKMSEMAGSPDRMSRVKAFYLILEKYVELAISIKCNIYEYERAKSRIISPGGNINFGFYKHPSSFLHHEILINVESVFRKHNLPNNVLPDLWPIDFIFDTDSNSNSILREWNLVHQSMSSDMRRRFPSKPRFERDDVCLPLQAADFWAWWVRKWHIDNRPDAIGKLDFGAWQGNTEAFPILEMHYNEEQIVAQFKRDLARSHPGVQFYDCRISFQKSSSL